MINVVITNRQDGSVRHASLSEGQHIFGASLNCDVVLLDHGVMAYHFVLDVREDRVSLDMLPERYSDNPEAAPEFEQDPDRSLSLWKPDDTLSVGGLDITIPDAPLVATADVDALPVDAAVLTAPTIRSPVYYWRALPPPLRITVSVGIALITLVMFIPNAGVSSLSDVSSGSMVRTAQAGDAGAGFVTPRDFLSSKGQTVYQQRFSNRSWTIDVYASNESEKKNILTLLEGFQQPVNVRFYQKSEIMGGVSAIVEAMAPNVTITSYSNGLLLLDGLVEGSVEAKSLADVIQNDVPAVRAVRFTNTNVTNDEAIKAAVSAIWYGDRSYVVIKDEQIIRPGQSVVEGVILRDVFSNAILVTIGSEEKVVRLDG